MSDARRRNPLARLRGRSPHLLAQYAALRLVSRLDARALEFPLLPGDLADSGALPPFRIQPWERGRRPRVAWLAIPPRTGSGGHTTQFRMMQAASRAGHDTTLLLYDRHGGDFAANEAEIRRGWPWLHCDIRPVDAEITGYDAVVATSWPTAHVIATRASEGRRLYFIQDFEPYFLPRGAEYALAEDSYRFGFRNIALGHMVHDVLRAELGLGSDLVPFGCDTDVYRLLPDAGPRSGVVFYAKRGNDRRGYGLALRALTIFHARRPREPIHVYGDGLADAPFPHLDHGSLPPERLNELYNSVVAGLALSFTNISLVAEELLASGVVPIVNDSPLARADLPNPFAVWARATPSALADALVAAVDLPAPAARVAASTAGRSWTRTQDEVVVLLDATLGAD